MLDVFYCEFLYLGLVCTFMSLFMKTLYIVFFLSYSRFRNRYKPPDVLGLSKEKFSSVSLNKDTYGPYGYIPSAPSATSSGSQVQTIPIKLI